MALIIEENSSANSFTAVYSSFSHLTWTRFNASKISRMQMGYVLAWPELNDAGSPDLYTNSPQGVEIRLSAKLSRHNYEHGITFITIKTKINI